MELKRIPLWEMKHWKLLVNSLVDSIITCYFLWILTGIPYMNILFESTWQKLGYIGLIVGTSYLFFYEVIPNIYEFLYEKKVGFRDYRKT